ncbi:uncharacterized protein A4U43_C03F2370 [Asparagus officinalis]|uniref:Uncharacterized protein n=1 Tax=Asparagus officinalis TaxID=4686 RepID=A0A5P1FBY2_ASPOF|nr:transcription factor MYB39-like [Asparagus officinalis]ONK74060.1 uncharacterized protein A4U43_C03F2370 [Asparagus officinalis]
MGRSPCCDENGLKKGPWTPEEDQKLVDYIQKHGHGSWRALPKLAGLNRCGKSCRLRWTNYLRPDIKRGKFSAEEEQTILNLHSILGNKWSAIATHLPGRTDNEIKNFWNTHLKKKLIQMGFDPMTHRPRTDFFAALPGLLALANLRDLVDRRPWDDHSLSLHAAEAVQTAKLQYLQYLLQSAASVAQASTNPNNNQNLDAMGLFNQSPVPCSEQGFVQGVDGLMPLSNDTNQGSSSFTLLSQGDNSTTPSITPLMEGLPPLADLSVGNMAGDACSTSSCGGSTGMSSFWPELLLDDPFMTEFV